MTRSSNKKKNIVFAQVQKKLKRLRKVYNADAKRQVTLLLEIKQVTLKGKSFLNHESIRCVSAKIRACCNQNKIEKHC